MTTVATLYVKLGLDAKEYDKGLDKAAKKTQSAGKQFGSLFGSLAPGVAQLATAAGAVTAVGTALVWATQQAAEAERVQAQLNAVLESTNHAAGLSADELDSMATELSRLTTYDDEAVKSTEALLLTFTSIGKDVFPDALSVVLDMSTALGQDLKSSAIQVGKALQDPVLGITALRRVGVNFTKDQEDMIKAMVESGKTMEAQRYILKELATEFGGSAAAAAQTFSGQMTQLKNEVGNLGEAIGAEFLPELTAATRDIKEFTIWVTDNIDKIREWGRVIMWISNPLGMLGKEAGGALRDMLGLGEATEENNAAMSGGAMTADDLALGLDDVSAAAEDAAAAEKEAAQAAKELTQFYKGLIGDMQSLHAERENSIAQAERLKQQEQEIKDEITREAIEYGNLRAEREMTQDQIDDHIVRMDGLNKKLAENAAAQQQLTADTQDATKQRIADTVLERLSKDELSSAEYEFFQDYLVQQGLITAADRDRAIAISSAADSIVADFERQNSVMDTTQAKIDALVNGSPYNIDININTHGGVPSIGGAASAFMPHNTTSGIHAPGGGRDSGGRGYPGEVYYIGTGAQPEMFVPDQPGTFIPKGQQGGGSIVVNINGGLIDRQTINLLTQEVTRIQAER